MWALYGVRGVTVWLLQALAAIVLLESVAYFAHYGLERKVLTRPHSSNAALPS